MNKTILGIFSADEDAQTAIEDLQDAGYHAKDISILMKNKKRADDFAETTGADVANSTVSGAVTGGVIGGIAGLLIGVGAIAVPGIGALLIGGPIAAALGATGAAATTVSGATTGVLAGGLIGALMGIGVSREDAADYEEQIKQGGILIAVPAQPGREDEVVGILEDNNAGKIRSVEAAIPESPEELYPEDIPYENRSSSTHFGAKGGKSKSQRKKRVTNRS